MTSMTINNQLSQTKVPLPVAKYARIIIWILAITIIISSILVMKNNTNILIEWDLLTISAIRIKFPIIIDTTRTLYSRVVLIISANVLRFSTIYIKEDKFINRFTILVILFVISMNILVFIPHIIILLLGWDGLGITSFILVIYYQNRKSLAAGIITAMTNRIGDVMLLLSIAWTLDQGHWNILHIINNHNSLILIVTITVAAMTKSAQIPFSSWLPAAMAAPTPVSALVHSSTLVTAGVFLLIRFYPFLHQLNGFNKAALFIGVSTILMARFSAITECDIKKIIALSTLRQLGIIVTRLGLNLPTIAFIHIAIHALFKALLFIAAGRLINIHDHSQDLRWFGNLTRQSPITSSAILISNIALCGAPFIAGFYSKDIIVERASFNTNNLFILFLIFFSISLTALYSIRISIATLWRPRSFKPRFIIKEWKEINIPIIVIRTISIIFGAIIIWILPITIIEPSIRQEIKLIPILIITLGLLTGYAIIKFISQTQSILINNQIHHFGSCAIWFLAQISSQPFVKLRAVSGHSLLKYIDQSWLELTGAQGINKMINLQASKIITLRPQIPVSYLSGTIIRIGFLCIISAIIT